MTALVEARWSMPSGLEDPALDERGVLYALLCPTTRSLLYIGKADGCSAWERIRSHLRGRVAQVLTDRGITHTTAIVADLYTDVRWSSQLVCDAESLLIRELAPPVNMQCRTTRIERPGMVVECTGKAWPHPRWRFVDSV